MGLVPRSSGCQGLAALEPCMMMMMMMMMMTIAVIVVFDIFTLTVTVMQHE